MSEEAEESEKKNNLGQYLKTFPPRSEIITEGDDNQDFFCLLEGKVEIWKQSEDGKKVKIGEIDKKGSYFGEISYLLKEPRTASIIADKEVKVLKFSGNMLPELILKQPNLGLKLCMTLAERLKGTTTSQRNAAIQRDELRDDITKQYFELSTLFQKVFIMLSSIQVHLNNEHMKAILTYMSQQKILRAGRQVEINKAFLESIPTELTDYVKSAYQEGTGNELNDQEGDNDTPIGEVDLLKDD
ncbi:MAG: cyclic nucleotide-binding domain-containing protein [Chlamydiales bacterium]|nr:cyclic nucleotide-binding domain-containing protein [Chlamydiales bacterium]NCF70419.1 cyclic nucleotide-binding domain-containing protein [Chlamydiales bacterium]